MTSNPSEDEVRHPQPTRIVGKPTFLSLRKLKAELYANAFAMPSSLGSGNSGHTVIVLGNDQYLAENGVEFEIPTNPGPHPVYPANTTSSRLLKNIDNIHATDKENFNAYTNAANLLKTQLLAAVEEKYYVGLSHRITGMTRVTVKEILDHLEAEHGKITDTDMHKNTAGLTAPWEPDTTMNTLWTRTDDAIEIAEAGGAPIHEVTIVSTLRVVLKATGAFTWAIQTWDDKSATDKTYDNFKAHFTEANVRRLEEANTTTVTNAGFQGPHAINAAAQQPVIPPTNPVRHSYCWTHGLTRNHTHNKTRRFTTLLAKTTVRSKTTTDSRTRRQPTFR
jgi:hypothetical protein